MNAANALRALVPIRPWRPPTQVGNGDAALQAAQASNIPSGPPSQLALLGTELIDWAATLCAARATQVADTQVPGVAMMLLAPALHASLRDALRGDLSAALHRLPLAGLALGQAARLVAGTLGEGVNDLLQNVPDHEPLVLALAACALLHQAQCGAPAPRAGYDVTSVTWLRRVRAMLDTWGTLRRVCNAHSTAGRAPAEPASVPLPPRVHDPEDRVGAVLQQAFPATAAARRERSAPCPAGDVALLSGVCAGRRKGPRPPHRPGGAGKPGGSGHTAPRHGPAQSHRRLAVSRLGLQSPSSNKESTSVAKSRPGKAAAGAASVRRKGHADGGKALADGVRTHSATSHAGRSAVRTPAVAPDPVSKVIRHCVPYQTERAVARQLQHGVMDARGLTYCAPPEQAASLTHAIKVRVPEVAGAVHWVQAHLLPHRMPPARQAIPVVRHATPTALHAGETSGPRAPLGGDMAYSTMTVAVSPAHPVRHPPRTAAPHLEPNTFRVLSVPQWDGSNRTVLAYFLNDAGAVCRGVKVGWLDVTEDEPGHVAVADTQSGYVLSGATLELLAEGVQRISGRRLLRGSADGALLTHAQNLQVSEQASWCGRKQYDVQAHNPELSLLRVRGIRIPGTDQEARMFPGSFMIVGDTLIHRDPAGRIGTLALQSDTQDQHTLTLQPARGHSQAFLLDYGLRAGVPYEALELIEMLEEQDLVFLPPPT